MEKIPGKLFRLVNQAICMITNEKRALTVAEKTSVAVSYEAGFEDGYNTAFEDMKESWRLEKERNCKKG